MAKPPDHVGDVQHPVGGQSYQLRDGAGRLWMRIGLNVAGQVDLGWPMTAYDFATVVTIVIDGGQLRTTIRKTDERAASTPGTDDVEVIALVEPQATTREVPLAVPPGGPVWARLQRTGSSHRVLDGAGALRAEIEVAAHRLVVRAYDEHGRPLAGQAYLRV